MTIQNCRVSSQHNESESLRVHKIGANLKIYHLPSTDKEVVQYKL